MTSLAFMFDEVPEPVWKASTGNWSSNSPSATRSAASAMRCATSESRRPSSPLARAAAALMRPSQRMTSSFTGSPETGKLATALSVSPPQSLRSTSTSVIPYTVSRGSSAAEADQLAGQPDGVVVGHEEAGAREDAQLGVGQALQRLLGGLQRVVAVLTGPEQERGRGDGGVGLQIAGLRVHRPAPGELGPGAGAVAVAADVGEGVADEVAGVRVGPGRELGAQVGAEEELR